MTQFDIIGALRTYCTGLSIKFIWQYDEFYANIESNMQYATDQNILVVDLRANPEIQNGKIGDITYSGLIMLGRKFDTGGTLASLDETALQKYDRRLLELTTDLVTLMKNFTCDNELNLNLGQIEYAFNLFDANIDFVVCQNANIVQ